MGSPRDEEDLPQIDLTRTFFSSHAIQQFRDRYLKLHPHESKELDFEAIARELLLKSQEESVSKKNRHRYLRRLLNNHCELARYFVCNGWRFVIKGREENGFWIVLTIERRNKKLGPLR